MAGHEGQRLLSELRRRRVLPVAGAYLVIGWLVTEIAGFLLEQADAPGWALRLLAIGFVVGFPVAVALAWVIQRQPDGRWSLDSSKGQFRSVAATLALGLLVTAGLAWLILPRIEDPSPGNDYRPLPNSLAILPFEAPHGAPAEPLIANTLSAALTAGLSQSNEVSQIRLRLAQPPEDLFELGRRIRAGYLLTGRLRSVAGGVRIEL